MRNIDYEQLYQLLFNMEQSNSVSQLSEKLYCSVSKASKLIKEYEQSLELQLYVKNQEFILSKKGKELLSNIEKPLYELRTLVSIGNNLIGIDNNLIEDQFALNSQLIVQYADNTELIRLYNSGKLDKLIISSDYEQMIKYKTKSFVSQKKVYKISNKNLDSNRLIVSNYGCPITKKLQVNGYKIDQYLNQSIAICKMVRAGMGYGYTFSTDTLDPDDILITSQPELAVSFYEYSKF